jgi:hypothetical protein
MEQVESDVAVTPAKWEQSTPGAFSAVLSVFSLIVGTVLIIAGVYQAFTYDDSSHLVGGDAFNLQILATRGTVLVAAGGACMAAAVAHAVFSLRAHLRARFPLS